MKLFLIGLLILFVLDVHAQWYYKYSVTNINDLSKEQLNLALQNTETKIKIGRALTFIGLGGTLLGIITITDAAAARSEWDSWEESWNNWAKSTMGIALLAAGGLTMVIGIPILTIHSNRKNSIEVALANFNSSTYLRHKQSAIVGLNFKIIF